MNASPQRPRVDLTKGTTHWPAGVKFKRAVWQWLVKPIFKLLPRPCNRLRIAILRAFGAQIGPRCLIEPRVDVLIPWNLFVDEFVAIGREVEIYNYGAVRIGRMTLISQYSFLCSGSHDYTHPHMPLVAKPIVIGSECWLAADVFVGPGVTIGDGAVIGARAVVTKNMPPWMVCAGNPCQPLKPRELRDVPDSVK
ncbi:MAG: putative colanic acid biosynthesis acetyltransferase [Verrucomicrobia bacterium]|nr:putative colanic acid biosynthesis acetyltransferase [Verrucomicrobiota bacterium]